MIYPRNIRFALTLKKVNRIHYINRVKEKSHMVMSVNVNKEHLINSNLYARYNYQLLITHPKGIWVHCDKGHKTCGLPMIKYSIRVLCTSCGCWAGPVGQGSKLEGKLQHLVVKFAT